MVRVREPLKHRVEEGSFKVKTSLWASMLKGVASLRKRSSEEALDLEIDLGEMLLPQNSLPHAPRASTERGGQL